MEILLSLKNHLGKAQHTIMAIEQMETYDFFQRVQKKQRKSLKRSLNQTNAINVTIPLLVQAI